VNEKLIKWIEETRKRDVLNVDKMDIANDNKRMFFYLEGRISAFSDVLLRSYYDKEGI